MKHLLTSLFLLLAILLPATATAHDFEVDGIYYNINGTNATVTYKGTYVGDYNNTYSGSVTIPETVTYNGMTYSVTSIGRCAFYDCNDLTSVTIPNSVIVIGDYAFSGCSGLTSVIIPNSVTVIGDWAFFDCSDLTSLTIPNSVTVIGDFAFEGCSGLTNILIPMSVISIGYFAFDGTPWYDTWYENQPNGLIYIGQVAYKYKGTMPAGTNLTLKEGTKGIAGGAFDNSDFPEATNPFSGMKSINIPNSVLYIGSYAFRGCIGLTNLTIPNSVIYIGESAFSYCNGLTSIAIPNSVTTMGAFAFEYCI